MRNRIIRTIVEIDMILYSTFMYEPTIFEFDNFVRSLIINILLVTMYKPGSCRHDHFTKLAYLAEFHGKDRL